MAAHFIHKTALDHVNGKKFQSLQGFDEIVRTYQPEFAEKGCQHMSVFSHSFSRAHTIWSYVLMILPQGCNKKPSQQTTPNSQCRGTLPQ
jgi:hypothetical protein